MLFVFGIVAHHCLLSFRGGRFFGLFGQLLANLIVQAFQLPSTDPNIGRAEEHMVLATHPFRMLSKYAFKIFSFHINQIMLVCSVCVVAQVLYLQEMGIDEKICRTLYLQRYCYLQGQQSDLATIQNDTSIECPCL